MDGGNHLKIYDLSDPAKPVYIRDFGMVGTQPQPHDHDSDRGEGIHGAISAGPEKNRVYIAYGTGNDGVISIVDRKKLLTEFKNPLTPTKKSCSRHRWATYTCRPIKARTRPSRSSACRFRGSRGIRRCASAICSGRLGSRARRQLRPELPVRSVVAGPRRAASRVPARYHPGADAVAALDVPRAGDARRLLWTRRALRRTLVR